MIVFAAIAPHGGAGLRGRRTGRRDAGWRSSAAGFAAARPEAAIVADAARRARRRPLRRRALGAARGRRVAVDADAETRYEGAGRPAARRRLRRSALQADGLPALGITFGATAAGASTMPLDWGALIPLWFMRAPAVVVSPCRALSNDEHVRAGRGPRARDRRPPRRVDRERRPRPRPHARTARTASRRTSAPYDARIAGARPRATASASSSRPDAQWAVDALADSFWQLLMLHGAIGDRLRAPSSCRTRRRPTSGC